MQPRQEFIADFIKDASEFRPHCLNLIAAGCGAGKSYFIANHFPSLFPDVRPCDILFVTSRSITVDQQVGEYEHSVLKYMPTDVEMANHWTLCEPVSEAAQTNYLRLMTFDKLIDLIENHNAPDRTILGGVKIVVIDECHALISDSFIRGVGSVRVWAKLMMQYTDMLFVGMTATSDVLSESLAKHGFPIRLILDKPLTKYRARHLWIVREEHLVDMLTDGTLPGKTIVMGDNKKKLDAISARVPNSAVLLSQHAKQYSSNMHKVRDAIVRRGVLSDDDSVDVLFGTTTIREGVTLRPESGVKNVVTMLADEMHVTQFLGRCRFDVENLVVVYDKSTLKHPEEDASILAGRLRFVDFILGHDDLWFQKISHLVQDDVQHVKRYRWNTGIEGFYEYVDAKWAVDDIEKAPVEKLIRKENHAEIIARAKEAGVFDEMKCESRYINIKRFFKDNPKVRIVDKRIQVNGERFRCDIIERKPETAEKADT